MKSKQNTLPKYDEDGMPNVNDFIKNPDAYKNTAIKDEAESNKRAKKKEVNSEYVPEKYQDIIVHYKKALQMKDNGEMDVKTIPTGLPSIDKTLGGGFGEGELIVIAGRTHEGKSAISLWIAEVMSRTHRVLFVSLEMTLIKNMKKFSVLVGNSSSDRNIHFMNGVFLMSGIVKIVEDWQNHYKHFDIIFIDYIQKMQIKGNDEQRELSKAMKNLHELAVKINKPIVIVSQLNRAFAMEKDKGPQLHHMSKCGDVENIADKILAVERKEEGKSILHILKNRDQGTKGKVSLNFNKTTAQFEESEIKADWVNAETVKNEKNSLWPKDWDKKISECAINEEGTIHSQSVLNHLIPNFEKKSEKEKKKLGTELGLMLKKIGYISNGRKIIKGKRVTEYRKK